MNALINNFRNQRAELASNALQLTIEFWLWALSLMVVLPLAHLHTQWISDQQSQTTYLVQELNSQTSLKEQRFKWHGGKLMILRT
jgi:hypothetical protein